MPSNSNASDGPSIETGVKFSSNISGYVTGVRFYKGTNNTGTHIGSLWSSTGVLLAAATFTNETASGWQEVTFPNPIPIDAGTVYVASYFSPTGTYNTDDNYFNSGYDNGPIHALSNSESANGVFLYTSSSAFPTNSYQATNYWVDVVFSTIEQIPDSTPPTVTNTSPADGSTNVPVASAVTADFSESIQSNTISFTLSDGTNNVPGTVTYDDSTHAATFTPSAPLTGFTTFTATVSGVQDTAGNPMTSPVSSSFTTASTDFTPPTVTATSPATGATGVALNSDVSATFSESVQSGTITMVLTDSLNDAIPGSVLYDSDTQTASFTASSALNGSSSYTMAVSGAMDLSGNTMSPVSWSFTTADVTPPTVTLTSPVDGTTDVPVGVAPSATFSESVQSGTIVMTVVDALDNPVPGTVTYDDPSHSATFTPDAPWRI